MANTIRALGPLAMLLTSLFVAPAQAHVTNGRERYGVIGYGIDMYNPTCAFACIDTVRGWPLDCHEHDGHGGMDSHHTPSATPECRASSDPYLQTLAWCLHTHCPGVKNSTLETVWEMDVVARQKVQPLPAYSYQVALSRAAAAPPTSVLDAEATLNTMSLVDEQSWLANFNGLEVFEKMEVRAETYGIVLMVTCVAIPIVFSWFRFLPLDPGFVSSIYAALIDPPLFGRYHSVPVLGLGFVPTRGQGLFIAYILIVNIILCAAGYEVRDPHSWYSTMEKQVMGQIGNRTGLLSFVNLALAVLFAGRNNVLLLVTNWSHSTFLLVHRWISVICMLQACVHSILYLVYYFEPLSSPGAFAEESKLDYWIWGVVATLALVLLMPLSVLPVRKKMYEVFLASHVLLAVLSMIGCMLHIYYRFEWQWGYQTWVWIAFAFWFFDRFLARPLRLARHGVNKAFITVIDVDYLRVDVPGVEGDGHAYLYFPTLTWHVWENHPFSVAAVSGGGPPTTSSSPASRSSSSQDVVVVPTTENSTPATTTTRHLEPEPLAPHPHGQEQTQTHTHSPGLVFFVRLHRGLTSLLLRHAGSATGIPVLVENSYGPHTSVIEPHPARPSLTYPNLVCVAGGVGITGVLPFLAERTCWGRKRLLWSVRTEALVAAVRGGSKVGGERGAWNWGLGGGTDVTVSVGKRFDIDAVLRGEVEGALGGTTVVVCGPAGMADEVRVAVVRLGRRGAVVRLVEESFSW
ncbi:hypothetical protein N658DRAFT_524460 [Parathielavia hyrcaniae]|uniref:Ferric oxidoreductase domain-containing protein n=1 Tax=Parathielavia hyrcaniae TaxID=113614 RepID=A0AAN6PZP4_9PEZI|nr:hypothetical protein N658DRAFT_524460 [Parathielavia hyrcaniae]